MLALTGSPAQAGVVTFARLVPSAVLALPAGLAADRYDRRRLMIAADAARAVALAALAAAILAGGVAFWEIPVWRSSRAPAPPCSSPPRPGRCAPSCTASQLPAAVGAQEARDSVVRLGGPPLGGVLFELGRAVPFLVDAVSYVASIASLWAMRTPFQQPREPHPAGLRAQIAEGFRFLWSRPFLRACAFLFAFGNFTLPGIFLVIVVVGRRQGLGGGAIGFSSRASGPRPSWARSFAADAPGVFDAGDHLARALGLAHDRRVPRLAERLRAHGAILPQALVIPVTNSVVVGYRVAVTPDRLLGRVETVRSTISLLIAPLGPLVARAAARATSARATVAVFAAFSAVLLVGGTLSPAIRHAPSLAELRP